MTEHNNQKPIKPEWKVQVTDFYRSKNLSPVARESLGRLLIGTPLVSERAQIAPSRPLAGKWSAIFASSLISATLAASATFLIMSNPADDAQDAIAELTQLPGPKVYPPDFDLEGDSLAMQDIVYELFADKDFFVSKLPAQVLAEYKPSEGRFFSWDGEPAVSIQMNKTAAQSSAKAGSDPATLFIVKLSEKSKRKFPNEKVTRKVAGQAGKMHKVKVWREGKFGYAMVQAVAVTETTP